MLDDIVQEYRLSHTGTLVRSVHTIPHELSHWRDEQRTLGRHGDVREAKMQEATSHHTLFTANDSPAKRQLSQPVGCFFSQPHSGAFRLLIIKPGAAPALLWPPTRPLNRVAAAYRHIIVQCIL